MTCSSSAARTIMRGAVVGEAKGQDHDKHPGDDEHDERDRHRQLRPVCSAGGRGSS